MSAAVDVRLPGDEVVLRACNGLGWDWLDAVMRLASERWLGVALVVVGALWLLFRFRPRAGWAVAQLVASVGLVDFLGHQALKPFWARQRPCHAMADQVRLLVEVSPTSFSFPSLHSANAFAAAVALFLLDRRTGWLAFPVAGLIALSRVFVGVHWPSDVLAGALYGSAVAFGLDWVGRRTWRPGAQTGSVGTGSAIGTGAPPGER